MNLPKHLIFLILLFSLSLPVIYCPAQSIENELELLDDNSTNDTKFTKKEDKDVIQIDTPFFVRLTIDIATMVLIILVIYFPNYRKMDYIFTFVIFNVVIFLLTFVLDKVKISMGAAFGLFAVFSMLRYRTAGINLKDMTYLFIFIALGLISAIQLEYYELGIIHGIIFAGTYMMDGRFIFRRESSKCIEYEKIELVRPERTEDMIEDLRKRTGLNIHRVVIGRIDFLKDTTRIRVYYYE